MWYEEDNVGSYLSDEQIFCLEVCDWFIDNKSTIQECADNFMLSYGKCWNILRVQIKYIDDDKYIQIKRICQRRKLSIH